MAYVRGTWPLKAAGPKRVELCGSFDGTPSAEGDITKVTVGAAGVYTVTLPGRGSLDFLCITATVESPDTQLRCVVSGKSETNRTVEVTVFDQGGTVPAARNLDTVTGERIHLRVTLHNTGLPKTTA